MPGNARLLLALLAAASVILPAQQAVREQPPLYRGPVTDVPGVFVTPIASVPFTATVLIETQQTLPDGTTELRHTATQIARDSRGRIRNERHALVSDSFRGTPPLLAVHIFDPATRISNIYSPVTLISRQQVIPAPRQSMAAGPNAKTEDLGTTALNGLETKGTRTIRTIPAQFSGTGKAVEIVDEFWYSEDLHMNLLERHTDPRSGTQTVSIADLKRVEPAPTLFEVPAGYKIVDLTPPAGAPAAAAAANR